MYPKNIWQLYKVYTQRQRNATTTTEFLIENKKKNWNVLHWYLD